MKGANSKDIYEALWCVSLSGMTGLSRCRVGRFDWRKCLKNSHPIGDDVIPFGLVASLSSRYYSVKFFCGSGLPPSVTKHREQNALWYICDDLPGSRPRAQIHEQSCDVVNPVCVLNQRYFATSVNMRIHETLCSGAN